jgi:predicted cupin superfamily sugar epimerase
MPSAHELIELLGLVPLPREGGFYRETYRSTLRVPGLTPEGPDKSAGTAIYYLLTPDTCSALHRLPTDEVYHFYLGDPVRLLMLGFDGGRVVELGTDLRSGQRPQVVVPAGVWQGSCLAPGGGVALLGTTMAPGFDFSDYEPGDRATLSRAHPGFADLIRRLTPSALD